MFICPTPAPILQCVLDLVYTTLIILRHHVTMFCSPLVSHCLIRQANKPTNMPQVYLLYKNSHPGGQGWLVGLLCYELSPLLGPVVLRLCAALHLVYSLFVLCVSVDCVRFVYPNTLQSCLHSKQNCNNMFSLAKNCNPCETTSCICGIMVSYTYSGEHLSKVHKSVCWYGFEARSCLNLPVM